MKHKISIIKATSTGLIIFVSLFLGIIIKTNSELDSILLLTYLITSLIVSSLSYFMSKFHVRYGPEILFVSSIVMGIYLFISMPVGQDGLSQLAAGIGWLLGMGVILSCLLIYTLISVFRRKG